jgi:imidazole glycerol-phosphate synthase subunit HisH
MAVSVGIVDYQMGNLRSVQKGIERVGYSAIVSSDPQELSKVSHLILPGVGAFKDAMTELTRRDLVPFLQDWTAGSRPFLGICLGMQLLFDSSDEGGFHSGLGILPGRVIRFEQSTGSQPIKIPHMGWNRVISTIVDDPMLAGLTTDPYVYFVHSYYVVPQDPSVVWLRADYGQPFCAAVRQGNIMATQFHPEKSQSDGLKLLANFCREPVI